MAIPGVAWALGAAERRIARRQYEQQVQEQQRRARASWQHTLKDLEIESAERQAAARRLAAANAAHFGAHGKAHGAPRQALAA